MLRFVTKADYWKVLDSGIMKGIPGTKLWHLKDIQDTMVYSHLHACEGLAIGEVGAGHPRLLGTLAGRNRCTAIDEYKGSGGGPRQKPNLPNIVFVDCMLGDSARLIAPASFDILFSVSVVEHVPTPQLQAFFDDCHRVLRPGGTMIHLIDAYLETDAQANADVWRRITEYVRPFDGPFAPTGPIEPKSPDDLRFSTTYATNPDNMMYLWNKSAPGLAAKRARAQSCAIEMVAKRS